MQLSRTRAGRLCRWHLCCLHRKPSGTNGARARSRTTVCRPACSASIGCTRERPVLSSRSAPTLRVPAAGSIWATGAQWGWLPGSGEAISTSTCADRSWSPWTLSRDVIAASGYQHRLGLTMALLIASGARNPKAQHGAVSERLPAVLIVAGAVLLVLSGAAIWHRRR